MIKNDFYSFFTIPKKLQIPQKSLKIHSLVPPPSIFVALSGGVDSSASLALLCQEAQKGNVARLEAAYIKTWRHETDPISDCPWQEDIADASTVCQKLGVPFRVVNLMQEYENHVVKMLVEGYSRGITPNPDIACNRFIKFGAFLQVALAEGFTHVATGHYAQIRTDFLSNIPQYHLLEGKDPNKDQSYFLAQLTHEQLSHALFPIGHLLKPEVRATAKRFGLPNHQKKDSQGICFLGKVKINDFLRRYLPDHPGPIVNAQGREIGAHLGLHHYTLGQRRGIGIPSNTEGEHYVVVAKDFATNTLRVAFDHPTSEGLYQTTLRLHNIHWTHAVWQKNPPIAILGRPRYRDPKVVASLQSTGIGEGILTFAQPQRALASGQLVAFYLQNELIGSGIYI